MEEIEWLNGKPEPNQISIVKLTRSDGNRMVTTGFVDMYHLWRFYRDGIAITSWHIAGWIPIEDILGTVEPTKK